MTHWENPDEFTHGHKTSFLKWKNSLSRTFLSWRHWAWMFLQYFYRDVIGLTIRSIFISVLVLILIITGNILKRKRKKSLNNKSLNIQKLERDKEARLKNLDVTNRAINIWQRAFYKLCFPFTNLTAERKININLEIKDQFKIKDKRNLFTLSTSKVRTVDF